MNTMRRLSGRCFEKTIVMICRRKRVEAVPMGDLDEEVELLVRAVLSDRAADEVELVRPKLQCVL